MKRDDTILLLDSMGSATRAALGIWRSRVIMDEEEEGEDEGEDDDGI